MLLILINNALKKYFDQDAEIAARLQQLENQPLLLKLTDLRKQLLITTSGASISVSEYPVDAVAPPITTTIHANIITLLRIASGADYQSVLHSGDLRIEGAVEPANRLYTIFTQVDIDWEEIASTYMGDALAHQLGNLARGAQSYRRRSIKNLRADLSEYLQEESRMLPAKTEIERFLHNVDVLDADIERLEARVRRLVKVYNPYP